MNIKIEHLSYIYNMNQPIQYDALNDINEKKIPHIKGVMYYAIRRQLDNDKVKKNTFLIIKEGY